jgi:hypothetical protein
MKMKKTTLLGFALLLVGFLALAYQGFSYIWHYRTPPVDSIEEHNPLPLSPVFGAISMFAGFVLIAREDGTGEKRFVTIKRQNIS